VAVYYFEDIFVKRGSTTDRKRKGL